MILLDGKKLAQIKYQDLALRVSAFEKKYARKPKLSVVIVGNDPASHVYVRNKDLACKKVGMLSDVIRMDESTKIEQLESEILRLNEDITVDGFLVQMPLPKHLKGFDPTKLIRPIKDVDGLSPTNMGLMQINEAEHEPCTPEGVMEILKYYNIDLESKKAVVVGRSSTVGWPMAYMLTRANCTVTVCHSRTKDLTAYTKEADIIVVAAGKRHILNRKHFKKEAVIIDVGIHKSPDSKALSGDVDFGSFIGDEVSAITPVPGGVGPMTVAQLITHTVSAAEKREGRPSV